jgi:hypothetical protein
MIQGQRDATAAAGGGPHRQNKLVEEYPCGMKMREYYDSLPEPWDVALTEYGPVKELHKVKFMEKFAGDRMGYAVWRRRFFAMVHTQRMLVADKAVALSAALDTKQEILSQVVRGLNNHARTYAAVIRELERLFGGVEAEVMLASTELFKGPKVVLSSLDSVRTFRVKLVAYRTILETHGQRETEFAPNSHLYRELMQSEFVQADLIHFNEQRVAKRWPKSRDGMLLWLDLHQTALESSDIGVKLKTQITSVPADQLNTAFTTTDALTFPEAIHEVAVEEELCFSIHEDTPQEIILQMHNIAQEPLKPRTNVSCRFLKNQLAISF